jgi:hypothetical protein
MNVCKNTAVKAKPLKNTPFCSISGLALWNGKLVPPGSGSNLNLINSQNTQCIHSVKRFSFPRSKSGIFDLTLNPAVSGEHFSEVSK